MKKILLILTLLLSVSLFAQEPNKKVNKEYWDNLINESLTNGALHNVINQSKTIITDSLMANKIAEIYLFKIYGKDNIEKQKPYSTYHYKNYWILSGFLESPKLENNTLTVVLSGTFLIIIDDRDGRIIRITHGK